MDLYGYLESALCYLRIPSYDQTTVQRHDLSDAFACGYVISMHKTNTYSPSLCLYGTELHNFLLDDIKYLPAQLQGHCTRYLDPASAACDSNTADSKPTRPQLHEAFICGYCVAIHRARKYDPVLSLTGHVQVMRIMGDLIAFQKKHENAQRACGRIVAKRYGLQDDKTILFDGGYIDDEGHLIDKNGHRINDDGQSIDQFGHPISDEES